MVPTVFAALAIDILGAAESMIFLDQRFKANYTGIIVLGSLGVRIYVHVAERFECANKLILRAVLQATISVESPTAAALTAANVGASPVAVTAVLQ